MVIRVLSEAVLSAAASFARWFDSGPILEQAERAGPVRTSYRIDVLRTLPYMLLHLACLAVLWVGWSPVAVALACALYAVRMFAITGFFHRYFAHRSFKTSRAAQFIFAVVGSMAVQRGPLWWASHHRQHHLLSDQPDDPHSPEQHGFWWSHTGWFLSPEHYAVRGERIKDWLAYPELRFLDRYDALVPMLFAGGLYGLGSLLERYAPALGTSGPQLLVWGFCISTVVLYHATFTINSLAHRWGRRRYATADRSRNSWWLALLTFGEGWHNNHHHYPAACRQGFYWWEIDLTYYLLRGLERLGVVWDLRCVPAAQRDSGRCQPAERGGESDRVAEQP
jgi:stearoyl-CoA desaturase (delta-9 desaturase)